MAVIDRDGMGGLALSHMKDLLSPAACSRFEEHSQQQENNSYFVFQLCCLKECSSFEKYFQKHFYSTLLAELMGERHPQFVDKYLQKIVKKSQTHHKN